MEKRKKLVVLVVLGILLALFLLVGLNYKINSNSSLQLTSEENAKVIALVNSYYNGMMNKEYEGALQLVDLEKSNYDKDVEILINSNYNIQPRVEGNNWILPTNGKYDYVSYHEQNECFGVETGTYITYNDQTFLIDEIVYIKRYDDKFKIFKIDTTDRYSSINVSYINKIFE